MTGGAETATVLFTDLVGSTELRATLGEEAADVLRRRHDECLRSAVEAHAGTVVKGLGDGIMATFSSAADGVAAAVATQQGIARLNRRSGEPPLAIRVGLSAGDVTGEGDDVFGEPVIEASRLCGAAPGGHILCSDVVRLLARGRGGHQFTPAGELELKGLPAPVTTYQVGWAATAADVPLPSMLRTRSPFPYVGRSEEREAIARAWKQAITGDQVAVLVAGEPGVGKTRLVAELAQTVGEEGAMVLGGSCDEQVNVALQPVVDALRHFLTHCPEHERRHRLGPHAADLARLVPEAADSLDGERTALPGDEDAERQRVFDAVAGWLAAAGAGDPVLLVLDDLHWADTSTVLLLRHLVRRAHLDRVLIVGTYRDTDVDRMHPLAAALADLRREPGVDRIRLRGLTEDDVASFVAAAAGHDLDAAGAALARALHTETEGNPFFLEEVLLHLIESGALYQGNDGRWTSDRVSIDDLGIPEGVREVVGRRLSRLSDACNRVLGRAAVLGASFDLGVLRAVADDADDLVGALEEAEGAGLIAEAPDAGGGYTFTHALVRHTLLDELSLARRQQYHLRAAETLESSGRANAPAVAFHYRAAGAAADPERAVTASLVAADEARRQLAWEEASDHWEAALELLDLHGGNPGQKARLLALLGDAMYATARDWERGLDQLERAVAIYDEIGDEVGAAKVRVRIGRNLSTFNDRVDIARAFANYEAAQPVLASRPASGSYGYLLIGFSTAHTFRVAHDKGEAAASQALEIAEETGNHALKINAELLLGWHRGFLGDVDDGLHLIGAAYEQAIELGNPVLSFLGAWLTAALAVNCFDHPTATRNLDRELDSGRLAGAAGFGHAALQMKTGSLIQMGRLSEAEELMRKVTPGPMMEQFMRSARGDWAAAERTYQQMAESAGRVGNEWSAEFYLYQRGCMLELLGDLESAAGQLRHMIERPWPDPYVLENLWGHFAMARVLCRLGRTAEAAAHAEVCRSALEARRGGRGLEGHLQMAVARTATDATEAEGRLQRAAEVASTYEDQPMLAEVLQEMGRLTGRVHHIDDAIAIYERCGMGRPWTERALELRSQL